MRIRTIKPSFWANDELAELAPIVRLLFIGLWNLADVRGRLDDRPKRIAAALFPYEREVDVDEGLDALAKAGFVIRYVADGVGIIQVVTFEKHQRINTKEADTESEFPEYDPALHGQALGTHPGRTRDDTGTHQGQPRGAQEGKGRERNGVEEGNGTDRRFAPPSREEVLLQCAKIGLPEAEGDKFIAFYESKGWMVGKTKMKSWAHALSGWKLRWQERGGKSPRDPNDDPDWGQPKE